MANQGVAGYSHLVRLNPAASGDHWPEYIDRPSDGTRKDHFISRDNQTYAGKHLILDFWGACGLDNPVLMEKTLRECVHATGATLLHIHLHRFSPSGGLSGVAVLAESHISVHTWPEKAFAAFDIFMCGDTHPERAVDILKNAFAPQSMACVEHLRGGRL